MRMDHSTENATIVTAIISLAHGLNMEVVTEGIETEQQRARVVALGCQYGQGYLFSKPVSFDDVVKMLLDEAVVLDLCDSITNNRSAKHVHNPRLSRADLVSIKG